MSSMPLPPLTREQADITTRMATLARTRFAPRAARHDAESSFPYENYRDLIGKGCSATALTFNMHSTVTSFIDALGTEAQKRRWFGEIVEHGRLIASITSEPEQSFRDKFVLNTVFRRVDGGFRVGGVKQFCSLGDAADYYFVTGVVEGTTSARDGVISAMIPRSDAGVKIEGVWNATGMRGTISHTIRYDSTVSHDDVVGTPGSLLTIDLSGFALGYAAVYLGIGEAAFDFMVEYAKTKTLRPSTEPMAQHPLVQRTVAEVGTALRAARLLLHEAATRALRLAGGRGILKELPLERWHRDALAGPVMPPANDRCLETAGKLLCGLQAATLEFQ